MTEAKVLVLNPNNQVPASQTLSWELQKHESCEMIAVSVATANPVSGTMMAMVPGLEFSVEEQWWQQYQLSNSSFLEETNSILTKLTLSHNFAVILFASEYSSNESVKPRLYLLSNKPKYQGLKTISIYFGDSNFRNSPWIRNAEFVKEGREKMVESFHVPFTFHCSKLVTEPNLVLMGLESVCLSTFCILRNLSSWKHLWTI